MPVPPKIFIAYSRKDEQLLNELRLHFAPLERSKRVTIWYDGKIEPGVIWEQEIKNNLHRSDIILLLVSASAIASDYFYDKEVKDSLDRHEKGLARVVPLILRPCAWKATALAKLQALPKDGKPVTSWLDRDAAYSDAVNRIWHMINEYEEHQKIKEAEELRAKAEAIVKMNAKEERLKAAEMAAIIRQEQETQKKGSKKLKTEQPNQQIKAVSNRSIKALKNPFLWSIFGLAIITIIFIKLFSGKENFISPTLLESDSISLAIKSTPIDTTINFLPPENSLLKRENKTNTGTSKQKKDFLSEKKHQNKEVKEEDQSAFEPINNNDLQEEKKSSNNELSQPVEKSIINQEESLFNNTAFQSKKKYIPAQAFTLSHEGEEIGKVSIEYMLISDNLPERARLLHNLDYKIIDIKKYPDARLRVKVRIIKELKKGYYLYFTKSSVQPRLKGFQIKEYKNIRPTRIEHENDEFKVDYYFEEEFLDRYHHYNLILLSFHLMRKYRYKGNIVEQFNFSSIEYRIK